ncbi:MAG: DUF4190 domain-containing protein [Sedimentisphaerales bacterium]
MYCQKCGADNLENAAICQQCGGVFVYSQPTKTSGMAITSMILGISGFSMFGVFGITWIIGLIFGILALNKIGKSGGAVKGKGFAVTGIITSAVGLALVLTVIGLFLFVHSATMISLSRKLKAQDNFAATTLINQKPTIKGIVSIEDKSAPGRNCENVLFTVDESEKQFSAVTMTMTCGPKGQEPIRLSWQFAGREKQADIYDFTIIFPLGENAVGTSKKKIAYDGTERVIFEDARQKIYVRPEK